MRSSFGRRIRTRGLGLASFALLVLGVPFVSANGAGATVTGHAISANTLEWYGAGTPESWDPALNNTGNNVKILSLVYSGLTRLNPQGNAVPDDASSWAYSDNGYELTFTLRPHLKFTDGTALNAQAVKYNINRDLTNPLSLVAPLLTGIKSETVLSPTVIRLNLYQQNWELPGTLAGKAGELVSPAAAQNETQLASQPVGAGAYKVTGYVSQGYTDFVKNPGYWDAKDIHITSIYQSGDTTPADILAAVQDGQANIAEIGATQVAAAEAAGYKVTSIQQLSVEYLYVNTEYPPYNNPDVVKAIGYALNRSALSQTQENGYGVVDDEPFPKSYFGFDTSKAVQDYYTYDPAKAQQLEASAGYPNGKGLNLVLSGSSSGTGLALNQQIQAQLEQTLGANVTLATVSTTEATQLEYVEHNVPLYTSGFVGRESALAGLTIIYDQNGLLNSSRAATPAVEAALAVLRKTPPTPRGPFLAAIDKVVQLGVETNPQLYLYSVPLLLATKGVSGIQPYVDFQELYGVTASAE